MKKVLSIIIPVYNVKEYLEKCVESILNNLKKYEKEYEIILVDDGSKDESGKICDKFSKKNKNIRVFHKENEGAASARNLGTKNAFGEMIMFVDSDDYVDENILKVFELIKEKKNDFDIFEFGLIFHKNNKIRKTKLKKLAGSLLKYSDCRKIIIFNTKKNSAVIRIIKTNFLKKNSLYFKEGNLEEDYNLTPKIWLKAQNYFLSDINYYHYIFLRPGSTTSDIKKKYFLDLIQSSVENFDLTESSNIDNKIKKLIKGYICFNVLAILRKLKKLSKEEQNEVLSLVLTHKKILKNPPTFETKLFMFFANVFSLKNALKLV